MDGLQMYRETLPHERRVLLDRYHIEDIAMKVVGVGSVGTLCAVVLLMAEDDDPLLLQVKEARPSVLAPYAGKSEFDHQGERIVVGQRLMQSASDMMLGWATGTGKYKIQFYIRQLRDMKYSAGYCGHEAHPVVPLCRNMRMDPGPCSRPVWRCCNDLWVYREIRYL